MPMKEFPNPGQSKINSHIANKEFFEIVMLDAIRGLASEGEDLLVAMLTLVFLAHYSSDKLLNSSLAWEVSSAAAEACASIMRAIYGASSSDQSSVTPSSALVPYRTQRQALFEDTITMRIFQENMRVMLYANHALAQQTGASNTTQIVVFQPR